MTEHRAYACDFCGTLYQAVKDAEVCEKSHHAAAHVNYLYTGPKSDYPDYLLAFFEPGVTRTYALVPQ